MGGIFSHKLQFRFQRNLRKILTGWILSSACLFFLAFPIQLEAQELISESKVADDPKGDVGKFGALNGKSHQLDIIASHNGWQYTAYYNDQQPRRVVVARRNRQIPKSPWETVVLQDYAQTRNDGHNVIAIGICPLDGTLHLAFDHHVDDLNYRRSVVGLLNDPSSKPWNASQFGPVTDKLGEETVTGVTYPIFVTSPSGRLYFSRRQGNPNNGAQVLYEYAPSTWKTVGKYIDGAGANPYMSNLVFSKNGRLHAGWIWRQGSLQSAHDICYAYSDDEGRTWFNSKGVKAGTTGSGSLTRNFPGITAVPVPKGKLMNQEGMTVDFKNRPHFAHRLGNTIHHFYQDESGTWHTINTGMGVSGRSKILLDAKHNAYILLAGFKIAKATESAGYKDWKVVYSHPRDFSGDALFDRVLLAGENLLSVFLIGSNYSSVEVIDYKLEGDLSASVDFKYRNGNSRHVLPEFDFAYDIKGRLMPTLKAEKVRGNQIVFPFSR